MVFCVWVFFLLHGWHCAIASILLTTFLHLCALEIYPCSCVSVHIAVSNCCIEFHMNLLHFVYLPPWYITSVPFYTMIHKSRKNITERVPGWNFTALYCWIIGLWILCDKHRWMYLWDITTVSPLKSTRSLFISNSSNFC